MSGTFFYDPFMAGIRPNGLQRGRGGFLRSADDAPYVSDPSGELVKSGERKGEVKRLKYGSPSNRGREIENDAGLVKYKQRLTLLGIGMEQSLATACSHLADYAIGSPEFNTAADTIVVCADRITRSSLAADRGTHGHLLCELFDRAEELTDDHVRDGVAVGLLRSTQIATVVAWGKMLDANALEILAIEASCVDDTWRLAGTLDRIVRTTRPLTFVKSTGELVTIEANTVLVLDIKFGKCRKAHPIQIASYAQSVPYDTETETRGEWPFAIDQTHALIAHGDFGDDTRPVTIELVWVDLIAGREHGGETVVQAKAWAARDDVFSVSQIVEGAGHKFAETPSVHPGKSDNAPSTTIDGEVAPPAPAPSTGEVEATCGKPSPASPALTPDPDRLALVDARAQLATTPSQGADLSGAEYGEQWATMQRHYSDLDDAARSWLAGLIGEATRRNVSFHARHIRSVRVFELYRALISLCAGGGDSDELLRALLYGVVGDVALFPGVAPGHVVGSLDAAQATELATLVDRFHSGDLTTSVDSDGTLRLTAA